MALGNTSTCIMTWVLAPDPIAEVRGPPTSPSFNGGMWPGELLLQTPPPAVCEVYPRT